ncbi:MAG TPA: Uma2 family endonuclease [Chthoniobacterales bacterium]
MPLTIELLPVEGRTAFNLRRWREVLADGCLATLPHRVETDRHGRIIMSPPPAFSHSQRQGKIVGLMLSLLPTGVAMPECPLSTSDGVKAIDVGWLAATREEHVQKPIVLERAPEICVEIISPSNTEPEMREKQALYFEAGAQEVWICGLDGALKFYAAGGRKAKASHLCPDFPQTVD